jgi:hypothetical protein
MRQEKRASIMGTITNFLGAVSVTISLFGNPLQAQTKSTPTITKLSCSGSFYGAVKGITSTEHDLNGVYIEISASSVKIDGIPILSTSINGSVYNISNSNERSIFFQNNKNLDQKGSINKITGKIDVYEIAERGQDGSLKFSVSFFGVCEPYKPIF